MITLAWWAFVGALALAAIVGGMGVAVLFALVADAPDAPAPVAAAEWDDDEVS